MFLRIVTFLLTSFFLISSAQTSFAQAPSEIVKKITINGEIEHGVLAYVKRAITVSEKDNAQALLVEINTPGGRVDSAMGIKDALLNTDIKTIAFVNHNALSAGALIALSMDQIYMKDGSAMGAATPITGDGQKASEKMVSALRSAFAAAAEAKDRDPEIARAMVDEDIEINDVTEKGKLLTLTAKEALALNVIDGIAGSEAEALKNTKLTETPDIQPISISFSENFVRFITSGMVTSILLTLGFLGMLLEFKAPGWGIAGLVSIIAYSLFFWGHHLAGLAGWEDISLMVLGVLLILVELFIIPGFGVPGLLGFIALIAGLAMAMVNDLSGITGQTLMEATTLVAATFVFGLILSLAALKLIFRRAIFDSGFVLRDSYTDVPETKEEFKEQIEKTSLDVKEEGIAVTDLRPAGTAMFKDHKFSVVTEGDFIEQGAKIKIIEIEGVRIVVREESDKG